MGRFNDVRAQRVTARRNETNSGDDCVSHLRHLPSNYLYPWDEVDMHTIIHFKCAQLSDAHMANSHTTPNPRGRTTGKALSTNKQRVSNQRKMVSTVRDIDASIADMCKSNSEIG